MLCMEGARPVSGSHPSHLFSEYKPQRVTWQMLLLLYLRVIGYSRIPQLLGKCKTQLDVQQLPEGAIINPMWVSSKPVTA